MELENAQMYQFASRFLGMELLRGRGGRERTVSLVICPRLSKSRGQIVSSKLNSSLIFRAPSV